MSAVIPNALKPTLMSGNAHPHAMAAVSVNTTTHAGLWNMDIRDGSIRESFCNMAAKVRNILQTKFLSARKKYIKDAKIASNLANPRLTEVCRQKLAAAGLDKSQATIDISL